MVRILFILLFIPIISFSQKTEWSRDEIMSEEYEFTEPWWNMDYWAGMEKIKFFPVNFNPTDYQFIGDSIKFYIKTGHQFPIDIGLQIIDETDPNDIKVIYSSREIPDEIQITLAVAESDHELEVVFNPYMDIVDNIKHDGMYRQRLIWHPGQKVLPLNVFYVPDPELQKWYLSHFE